MEISQEMMDFYSSLTKEQKEMMAVTSVTEYFNILGKKIQKLPLESKEALFLANLEGTIESYIEFLGGEEWLKKHNIKRPDKKIALIENGVYIELSCPHCKVFGVYMVEPKTDCVIECRACEGKIRIRKDRF